jgi:hypothetical protein
VTRLAYLAQIERICEANRAPVTAPPNRSTDPRGFGRWLRDIATSNQSILDKIEEVHRPAADEAVLADLFAGRQHANDLYLRAASAFDAEESLTGEQFLRTAMETEADFRERARAYGFNICIGSDTPGR